MYKNGVPILTVVADGNWPKHSFRNNYSSLSGVAAIVGFRTGKVIFLWWRNKYRTLCKRADNAGVAVKQRTCYKNFTGMESDIIDGFVFSMEMYGVKYGILIADGDANVNAKILQARPCDYLTVEKLECTNYIVRNCVTKLKDFVKNGKLGNDSSAKSCQIPSSTKSPTLAKLRMLKKYLINSPRHIVGEHRNCKEIGYFCSGAKEVNYVPELTAAEFYTLLQKIISGLTDHCRCLLKNLTNNVVEQFFSRVAKFVGGKRGNYTQKRSYKGHCTVALVSHNMHRPLYLLHKAMCTDKSSGKYTRLHETRRLLSIQKRRTRTRPRPMRRENRFTNTRHAQDKHYGPNVQKPDLPEPIYKEKKHDFLECLVRTKYEIAELDSAADKGRDYRFWCEEMQAKLQKLYLDCLLPELVNARHRRSLPIQDPPYILEALQTLKKMRHSEDDSGIPKSRNKLL
ncbi:hypothetical protein PR048_008498 [Dryococelus australis]|uniref:Mutator-like transposase domain-containing protein n=1 Tax=Dryococelus australis TaxID=614101 RepID=A0ABQ9HXB1_9NEOP|nr:hypothetical protein PR048_008498 [Dryococelus australis]